MYLTWIKTDSLKTEKISIYSLIDTNKRKSIKLDFFSLVLSEKMYRDTLPMPTICCEGKHAAFPAAIFMDNKAHSLVTIDSAAFISVCTFEPQAVLVKVKQGKFSQTYISSPYGFIIQDHCIYSRNNSTEDGYFKWDFDFNLLDSMASFTTNEISHSTIPTR